MPEPNNPLKTHSNTQSSRPSRRSLRKQMSNSPRLGSTIPRAGQSENTQVFEAPNIVEGLPVRLLPHPRSQTQSEEVSSSSALSGKSEKKTKFRIRKFLSAVCAVTAASGLVVSSVFPVITDPTYGTATAEAEIIQKQRLVLDDANAQSNIAFSELRALEVPEVLPEQISTEIGLIDPNELENSEVRYPFDQEVRLTDRFGYRTAPVEQFHDAQDFAAAGGTPILAIASGVVVEAGFVTDWCGFGLKLQHRVDNQTVTSHYCHMQANSHSYRIGDSVKIGDLAGRVGNTGLSFGNHLHLALRLNGEAIDPMPYFSEKSAD